MRSQYREMAVAWDEARDGPKTANRIFDSLHCGRSIRPACNG